jgi:Flp pilus assembly protein CpaB
MGIAQPAVGRTARAVRARVSNGHVVMVLAGALGVLLTLGILRGADQRTDVLVAARDLAPGTVLDDTSVRIARVRADGAVLATLFPADTAADAQGRVVTGMVRAGELLARSSVRAPEEHAATRVMSVAIPRPRAVAGRLGPGDVVDVVAVERDADRADYVATGVEVVGVDAGDDGALAPSDDLTVSLVVTPESAPLIAAAVDGGAVMLVRATGAAPLAMPGKKR